MSATPWVLNERTVTAAWPQQPPAISVTLPPNAAITVAWPPRRVTEAAPPPPPREIRPPAPPQGPWRQPLPGGHPLCNPGLYDFPPRSPAR